MSEVRGPFVPLDFFRDNGLAPQPPSPFAKVGLAVSGRADASQKLPLHGLRERSSAAGAMSGWYLWGGEFSEHDDFFQPSHVAHLARVCPLSLPFLSLPEGWRFYTDGDVYDVWYDETLLR